MKIDTLSLPTMLPRLRLLEGSIVRSNSDENYTIGERLGEGAAGIVFECTKGNPSFLQRSRPKYALKVLLPLARLSSAPNALERMTQRFRAEALRSMHLDHPNLTRTIDLGEIPTADGRTIPFYAMEYLEADSLDVLLKSNSPPIRRKLEWAVSLIDAVSYLHENNMLHRDIKPANILVEKENKKLFLTDFGVVSWGDFASQFTDGIGTYPTEILTTWDYLAPEVEIDPSCSSVASDSWGLGKTLNEIFTWRIIPRIHILTGQYDWAEDSESSWCSWAIKKLCILDPVEREDIELVRRVLVDYLERLDELTQLDDINFDAALSAVESEARQTEALFSYNLNKLRGKRVPENQDGHWLRCDKCGSRNVFVFDRVEHPGDEFIPEYDSYDVVCLGKGDQPCSNIFFEHTVYS